MKTPSIILIIAFLVFASSPTMGEVSVKKDNAVLLPVKNDPTICFRIWFKVGSQDDPVGKEGLSLLTALMLSDGSTLKNGYEQIIDKLYPLAASYNATSTVEMTVLYGRVHKDNLKAYYPLFIDAITSPAFTQADLDRIKSETLNSLENTLRYSSDEELGKAVLYNDIFAGTPYGHIPMGTVESVRSITVDDVKEFYKAHYTRDNVVIGLGGGYTASLLKTLRSDLSTLPAGAPAVVAAPHVSPINGFRVTIVEKDAPATAISMGFPISLLRGTPEWYALAVANSWLGEHRNSSSHLYEVIREKRGLNYGDYSYIENYPRGGQLTKPPQNVGRRQQIFEIWIRPVPAEAGHFALRAALRELKKLVDNGMTQEGFTLSCKFLKKYVLQYAPTTMERLGYALDDRYYGIDGSHLKNFRSMMEKLTLADVNKAIKKHLQFGNMQIAIVTKDANGLRDALLNDAASPITYKTPKAAPVLAEDEMISAFPVRVDAGQVKIVPVSELFK